MNKHPGIPELLEQYMEEHSACERGSNVNELRDRFNLTRYQSNTVSGFLRRLEFGSFGQLPFTVISITRSDGQKPSGPKKCRYLVKRKTGLKKYIPEPEQQQKQAGAFAF